MPASENDFGSRRLLNGERTSQHTGRDAPDPFLLLNTPSKLPSIGDPPRKAEAKIDSARASEPQEVDPHGVPAKQ